MPDRLSLHELHAAAGATFVTPCGIELPDSYGDAAAEYEAVRQGVGLIDHGNLGVLEVTGRDRASFLHGARASLLIAAVVALAAAAASLLLTPAATDDRRKD